MPDIPSLNLTNSDRFIEAALSGLAARQRTIANNVANADTPNFKVSEVPFEQTLQAAINGQQGLSSATQSDLNRAVAQAVPGPGGQVRADGNNVDIDRQMVELSETSLSYNSLVQAMAGRLAIMRSVISGR